MTNGEKDSIGFSLYMVLYFIKTCHQNNKEHYLGIKFQLIKEKEVQ